MPRLSARALRLETLEDRVVPAVIGDFVNFGDSLSDVGNASQATSGTFPPAAFYFDGRFGNGPVWVETLAEYLGEAAPVRSLAGGLDFAFGGSALTPGLNPNPNVPTVAQQIALYDASNNPTPDDLFTIWAGANDFFYSFNATVASGFTTPLINPAAVAAQVGAALDALIAAGGRQFVVANLPLLGQTPFFQDIGSPTFIGIADNWSAGFNAALANVLSSRDSQAGVDIVEVDVAGIVNGLKTTNPLGLTDFDDAVGPYDPVTGLLTGFTPGVNPNDFLFYDSVHPTTRVQQFIGFNTAVAAFDEFNLDDDVLVVRTATDGFDTTDHLLGLREAILLSNALDGKQTITFDLGAGNQFIHMLPWLGQMTITHDVDIVGTGPDLLFVNGQNQTRIFYVGEGAKVKLYNMTLGHGRAEQGGALVNAGELDVANVVFVANQAVGPNARGGAIYNVGDLDVEDSVFHLNSAIGTSSAFGGAIASEGSGARGEIDRVRMVLNTASGPVAAGGAVFIGAGTRLRLVDSLIAFNQATGTGAGGFLGAGGGVLALGGDFFQHNSIITANLATTTGLDVF